MAKDYLRDRPFMVVNFLYRPREGVKTEIKGWSDVSGSMQTMEQVGFVDRINNIVNHGIVIDIINSKVLRNTTDKSDDEIVSTYLGTYRDDASKALAIWAQREAAKIQAESAEAVLEEVIAQTGSEEA